MRLRNPGPPPLAAPGPLPEYRVARQPNYAGAPDSLAAMAAMARLGESDPTVRQWALDTVREVYPRDYLSEAAALFYRTCRDLRYTRDPSHTEHVSHPAVALKQRAEDCDGMATVERAGLGALAAAGHLAPRVGSIGVDAEFVAVGFRAPVSGVDDALSHVYLQARDPASGRMAVMDPVAGPWTPQMLRRVRVSRRYPV